VLNYHSFVIDSPPWHVAGRGGWGGEQTCVPGRSQPWKPQSNDWDYDYGCDDGGSPGDVYDDTLPLTLLRPGSGGGKGGGNVAGGNGGAAIIFYSEEIALNGNIKANGSNGGRGADNEK